MEGGDFALDLQITVMGQDRGAARYRLRGGGIVRSRVTGPLRKDIDDYLDRGVEIEGERESEMRNIPVVSGVILPLSIVAIMITVPGEKMTMIEGGKKKHAY
ncbi:hypothetical protein ACJ73_06421 [Blastomyces percursus]|uniref:Uncharacterized protein n=1 Tax=Blastomyces percursus TaxID=1658174 RepID=A0A1J9Q0T7_9EURO|nr:hypothetical protein ACJ73_06421 [Blastomyces percursus]